MSPENKNLQNVIDITPKLEARAAAALQAEQDSSPEEPPKPNYLRRRIGAAVVATLAIFGGVKATEAVVHEAPQVVESISDAAHQTNESDLTYTIPETVTSENNTLEELAVEADPSVDPRIIESALKQRSGITDSNIQPGQIIDVPVTAEAVAEHADEK